MTPMPYPFDGPRAGTTIPCGEAPLTQGGPGMPTLMRLVLCAVLVGLAGMAGSAAAAASAGSISREAVDTFLRMRILSAVLDAAAVPDRPYPGPTPGLVQASWLEDRLPAAYRGAVRAWQDAWGGPLMYWSDGRHFMILSRGQGGQSQFDYSGVVPYRDVPRAFAGTDPSDDFIIVDGMAWRGPATQTELLAHAMADLRGLGTAAESYAIDYNVYPGPVQPLGSIDAVVPDLEPVYIRRAPRQDPWGNPYLYWSDGTAYALISRGADGRLDTDYHDWGRAEYEAFRPAATFEPGKDVVFVTGAFVQWPAALGTP